MARTRELAVAGVLVLTSCSSRPELPPEPAPQPGFSCETATKTHPLDLSGREKTIQSLGALIDACYNDPAAEGHKSTNPQGRHVVEITTRDPAKVRFGVQPNTAAPGTFSQVEIDVSVPAKRPYGAPSTAPLDPARQHVISFTQTANGGWDGQWWTTPSLGTVNFYDLTGAAYLIQPDITNRSINDPKIVQDAFVGTVDTMHDIAQETATDKFVLGMAPPLIPFVR